MNSVQNLIEIQGWLLLTFFMFTQSIEFFLHNQLSSYNSIIVCLKNVIIKNEWLLVSVTFTAKFELIFVLTFENGFS